MFASEETMTVPSMVRVTPSASTMPSVPSGSTRVTPSRTVMLLLISITSVLDRVMVSPEDAPLTAVTRLVHLAHPFLTATPFSVCSE